MTENTNNETLDINDEYAWSKIIERKIKIFNYNRKICKTCGKPYKLNLSSFSNEEIEESMFRHYHEEHFILDDILNFLDAPQKVFNQMERFVKDNDLTHDYIEYRINPFRIKRLATEIENNGEEAVKYIEYFLNHKEHMLEFFECAVRAGNYDLATEIEKLCDENKLKSYLPPLIHATEKRNSDMIIYLVNSIIKFDFMYRRYCEKNGRCDVDNVNYIDDYNKCILIMENVILYCDDTIIETVLPKIYDFIYFKGLRYIDEFLIRMKEHIDKNRYLQIYQTYNFVKIHYVLY